jgi:hypothetical protein
MNRREAMEEREEEEGAGTEVEEDWWDLSLKQRLN